jgi:hypothetical protein
LYFLFTDAVQFAAATWMLAAAFSAILAQALGNMLKLITPARPVSLYLEKSVMGFRNDN